MSERSRGTKLIVPGGLNVDLERTGVRGRYKDIAVVVATAGLEVLSEHFLPQRRIWCRDRRTLAMVRQGREVSSRTDYILGYD